MQTIIAFILLFRSDGVAVNQGADVVPGSTSRPDLIAPAQATDEPAGVEPVQVAPQPIQRRADEIASREKKIYLLKSQLDRCEAASEALEDHNDELFRNQTNLDERLDGFNTRLQGLAEGLAKFDKERAKADDELKVAIAANKPKPSYNNWDRAIVILIAIVLLGFAGIAYLFAGQFAMILARVPNRTTAERLFFQRKELERMGRAFTGLLRAEKDKTCVATDTISELTGVVERWKNACHLAEVDAARSAQWSQDRIQELVVANDALVAEMREEMSRAQRHFEQELSLRDDRIAGLRKKLRSAEDEIAVLNGGVAADTDDKGNGAKPAPKAVEIDLEPTPSPVVVNPPMADASAFDRRPDQDGAPSAEQILATRKGLNEPSNTNKGTSS